MTVAAPVKQITVKNAIKQAGRSTTAGASSSGQCKDCVKTKLALYISLTALGPAQAAKNLPRNGALLRDVAPAVKLTDESAHFVRPPRPGYIYVFKEKAPEAEQWEAYTVGSDGLLRLEPVGQLTADPGTLSHPTDKQCSRSGHNSFSPQFISIDPERYPKVWIAFSEARWSDKVLDDFAANINVGDTTFCRLARMQPYDLKQIANGAKLPGVIEASAEALEANVAGFKAGDITEADNSRLLFPVPRRDGQAASVAKRMAEASRETKVAGVIISLNDPAGILGEANWQRQRALAEKSLYQSDPEVAWRKLSAEAVGALRERILQQNKAKVIQDKTGKPWSKDNDPKLVQRSPELIHKSQFDRMQQAGTLPKGSVFKPMTQGYALGHIWVPTDSAAAAKASGEFGDLDDQYDEGKRKAFLQEYDDKLKEFDVVIEKREKDWNAWVTVKRQPGLPDLTTLAVLDHRETDRKCAPYYARLVGQCVGMGPLAKESLPWFEATLKLPIKDEKQILLRSLFGNQKNLIAWADEEKKDKLYDMLKGIADAEDLKAGKWATIMVAGYANATMSGIGAAAMALNKNGSLDKALRDKLTRYVCATLKLWDDVEIGLIRIAKVRLGDLHQGLLAAAYGSGGNIQVTRQTAQAARTAARARLPAAVADKTIDAILWTADKSKNLDNLLKSLPSAPAQARSTAAVNTAEQSLKKVISSARTSIPPGGTRDFITQVVKGTDSVMGKPGALMAAGVIWIQWFQGMKNLEEAQRVGGAQQLDALLGLGDALASIMGASAEVYKEIGNARAIAKNQPYPRDLIAKMARWANRLSGAASLFNSVQSFGAAGRRWGEGDKDAGILHGIAGGAFVGAAVASFAMGGNAVFFGTLLGLGPVGWAVLFTGAAVALTYAAISAEDTDAEIYVARNKFWSKGERSDPEYKNWREEASSFAALWYGVKLDIDWGDSIVARRDSVTMEVTISEADSAEGWRYRFWATFPNGKEGILDEGASQVAPFASPYPDRPTTFSAYDPKAPHFFDGEQYKRNPLRARKENGIVTIEQTVELDDDLFKQVRVEFEYYPDAADMDQYARLERIETD